MRHASRFENVSFYLAFLHLTSPIPGKGCSVMPKSRKHVILPSVFDFDLSNPWEGVTRHADDVSFYEAFGRSTRPIHGKGCIPDGGVGAGSRFRKNI